MSVPPSSFYDGSQHQQQQKIRVVAGYALQQRLGSGSFATVYKGVRIQPSSSSSTDTSNNESSSSITTPPPPPPSSTTTASNSNTDPDTVAIKAITRTSEKLTKKVLQNLEIEISILRTYRHPNIVCMHNVQKTDRHFYLILEYCAGGDVQRLIRTRKSGRLTERLARRLMRDLSGGLRFLWGQELIHRDIKPQNLLLTGPLPLDELDDPENTPDGEAARQKANFPSESFGLKIADFGFARHLQTASLAETLCGSPLYMAPEILQHHRYDAKADLWSVGTVLFEMIAGRPPFNGENHIELLRNIQRKAVRLPPDVRVSKPCVNLLRLLLNRNPLSRAGFKEFFEACDAFVALGCEGVTSQDPGSCIRPPKTSKELGTIQEDGGDGNGNDNDGSGHRGDVHYPSTPPASDSLMTVATTAGAHPPINQHQQPTSGGIAVAGTAVPSTAPRIISPPFDPLSTPTSLIPNPVDKTPMGTRKYPNRLAPLEHSPPAASPPDRLTTLPSRVPVIPSLSSKDISQSQASTDDSGFVMVEHGSNNSRFDNYMQQQQTATIPPSAMVSATSGAYGTVLNQPSAAGAHSNQYYMNTTSNPSLGLARGDYMVVNDKNMPSKGMLSTSPGTGGLLMGLYGRVVPRLAGSPAATNSSNRLEAQLATVNKMIATAEDVGRRAISVAHLGDTRAYVAMRLVFLSEEGSSLLSNTPMEEVEEEPEETGELEDDANSTEIMVQSRRHSSTSIDKVMTDAKIAQEQSEEMPFAISPDAPAVSLPSRVSASVYSKNQGSASASKPTAGKPSPAVIRGHFGEALSCYLKALKMLKGAVGAVQRVRNEIESVASQLGRNQGQVDIPNIRKRCDVTSNWLSGQFRGVLERADAANVEISKLPSSRPLPEGQKEQTTTVCTVEELIYNHSLASGRDGAVKQLLGQYEAARSCYRSAGLLAETLLMETGIGAEDRNVLEGYVDGFAARITELDQLMLNQSRMIGSNNISASRRGSGVIGLIGPAPTAPFAAGPSR